MNSYKAMQIENRYDCVVIGGGASGMMAAITAARNGARVAIVEHTARLGSKILQTGNGKCNFTNLDMDISKFQNDNKEFVGQVLDMFDQNATIEFFKELGVWHKERAGYVYPHSETAASLQEALRLEVERLGISVYLRCRASEINKVSDNTYDMVLAEDETDNKVGISVINIIIATGSKAAPKTGSDGSGYKIAKKFGHTVKKPLPALVQLISDNNLCKSMAGVRSTGKVMLYVDDVCVSSDIGEIQYADYGISGIPVFQISRYAVEAVDKGKSVKAIIDMIPDISKEELYNDVRIRKECETTKSVEQFFAGIVNKKLVCAACKNIHIDINASVETLKLTQINNIIDELKYFCFNIISFKGFESGQICQGGVVLSEVNASTMASHLADGVYFAGEILDVDGMCGGYNLQWAWSSGFVAGLNAAMNIR